MKKTKKLNIIGLVSIALFIFLSLFSKIDIITANGIVPSQRFNTNFVLDEYSKFTNSIQNANSINITLPSSSWSIQDIELNFTDIKFGKEIKIIEDQNYTSISDEIYHQTNSDWVRGLGVQIKLTEPTTIYGVDLYGEKVERGETIIDVQIRGYDALNNKPNSSVYSTVEINMSTTEGWYRQTFPSSVLLSAGNYFLVINGSDVVTVNDDRILWYYNHINPSDPSLYTSYYNNTEQWSVGIQNYTYLHKLIQKVNTPIYPEEINMTVKIDDQFYQISNTSEGKGYFPKTVVDFSPSSDNYQIIVNNQASESLFFNVSSYVTLTNNFFSPSSVVAQLGTNNKWSVKPTLVRQPTNYSVLFKYPTSWENISVLKDEVDITLEVIHDTIEHQIIILNDSISDGANWEIVADSTNVEFSLNIERTEYELGQEIQFSLTTPIPGTYIFILLNSAGVPVQNQTITYPSETVFSYNLNLTDLDGTYTAYVFWFSDGETNAGVQSEEFFISLGLPTPEFPFLLIIFIVILGVVVLGLVSYIAYKRINSYQRNKLEKFLSQCTDISNINEIIVIDTKSGIDVFSQSLGGRKLDTSLISGFLQAISNFGTALSEEAKQSRTLNIAYKDSIIMQTETAYYTVHQIILDAIQHIFSVESIKPDFPYENIERYQV